ncbi:MAG: hypothetical protein Q7T04_05845 [Dehalococcoidia bacterium]|nr:hypothetical protein [Dehalococcoidia bacterium]
MEWQVVVAIVLAVPVILFPVAFVWYLNIGGIYAAMQKVRRKRAARRDEMGLNSRRFPPDQTHIV